MLTIDQLQKFAPRPKDARRAKLWDHYTEVLLEIGEDLALEHGIDEASEWHGFIANVAHECGGFTVWQENGNYSDPNRIMEIFGVGRHSSAVTQQEAVALVGRGPELFERVYGVAVPHCCHNVHACTNPKQKCIPRDLKNEDPGDGWNCRGLGPLQTTGGEDHLRMFGRKDGQVSMHDAWKAAFQEWDEKNCNERIASGDFKGACKAINGGFNGLADRRAWLAKAEKVWPTLPFEHAASAGDTKPLAQSTTAQAGGVSTLASVYGAQAVVKAELAAAQVDGSIQWGKLALGLLTSEVFVASMVAVICAIYVIAHRATKPDVAGVFKRQA